MSKLVDRERLARLAAGLDARMKAAVKAENERAVAAEEALDAKISAINNGENGILKQAKDYADQKDAEMKQAYEAKDGELDQAIKDEAADREAADSALDGRVSVLETFKNDHSHATMEQDIKDLKAKDTALDGDIKNINDAASALEARVKANEDFNAAQPGKDANNLQAAKNYADEKITALVDSAPDAMNTLNELAKAIKDNKDVYDGYVAEHATAMANMKKDLQDEIDADVKVVADELAKQMNENEEGSLASKIKAEETARDAKDNEFEGRISANEAFVAAQPGVDAAQDAKIKALEDRFAGDNSVENQIQNVQDALDGFIEDQAEVDSAQENRIKALEDDAPVKQAAIEAAQAAADKAQEEVDAVEGRVEALETFKGQQETNNSNQQKAIEDNAAAIAKEIEDRDTAITEALKGYTDSESMMAILGNVVNSLALSMENNKMVLRLGGEDGIEIHSTSLDMATEADIDEIIAGLDAPQN